MSKPDLHKLALRLKVIEMLRLYSERRQQQTPMALWQRWVCPN